MRWLHLRQLERHGFAALRREYSSQAAVQPQTRHVWASVLLERLPVITPEMTEIERQMAAIVDDLDVEGSVKSDFELRSGKEKEAGVKRDDNDGDALLMTQDIIDAGRERMKAFEAKVAQRTTEADKTNDRKSIWRALNQRLIFAAKQADAPYSSGFMLPRIRNEHHETLRQSIERLLADMLGEGAPVQIMGNAPIGHYEYGFNKNELATIFFYRAIVRERTRKLPIRGASFKSDYQWLTGAELLHTLFEQKETKRYGRSVERLLH